MSKTSPHGQGTGSDRSLHLYETGCKVVLGGKLELNGLESPTDVPLKGGQIIIGTGGKCLSVQRCDKGYRGGSRYIDRQDRRPAGLHRGIAGASSLDFHALGPRVL